MRVCNTLHACEPYGMDVGLNACACTANACACYFKRVCVLVQTRVHVCVHVCVWPAPALCTHVRFMGRYLTRTRDRSHESVHVCIYMYSTDQLQGIKRLRFTRMRHAVQTRSKCGVNAKQMWSQRIANTHLENTFVFQRRVCNTRASSTAAKVID